MTKIVLALILVSACSCGPSKPLAEAILGEWEVLCRTDQESTASCLDKENRGMFKQFFADGRLVSGARQGISMSGTWTLTGDELKQAFDGGGMHIEEIHRARIEDDKLVLWYPTKEFGAVLGRVGAPFKPAPSKVSSGAQTSHTLGALRYTLALPAGYRLSRDDNDRQQWSPSSGAGFIVGLSVSKRAQTQVDGNWVTPPCNDYDYGGVLSSSNTIDGVERDTSIGVSRCLDDAVLMCRVEHSRGYLEKAEQDAAVALCNSLVIER